MTPHDILLKAADLIETTGWCQHTSAMNAAGDDVATLSQGAVRFCALGALRRVTGGCQGEAQGAQNLLGQHLGLTVSYWNDAPERTADEVIAALRAAAVSA